LKTAVARNRPHLATGTAHRRTDGRRKAEPHSAEAAGRNVGTGLLKSVVLRQPHLVLADVSGANGIAPGYLVDRLDDALGHDLPVPGVVPERILLLPLVDLLQPRLRSLWLHLLNEVLQDELQIADDRNVGYDVLADLRRVDVDMDHFGMGSELGKVAGHPVVEPGPASDEQITPVDGP